MYPNTAQLTSNLRHLIKRDVPFVWGTAQENSFKKLKEALCKPPVLAYFNVHEQIK